MLARLVAVNVIAYQAVARDILRILEKLVGQVHRKERIETLHETFVAAHSVDHAPHIVRHIERVVPRIARTVRNPFDDTRLCRRNNPRSSCSP